MQYYAACRLRRTPSWRRQAALGPPGHQASGGKTDRPSAALASSCTHTSIHPRTHTSIYAYMLCTPTSTHTSTRPDIHAPTPRSHMPHHVISRMSYHTDWQDHLGVRPQWPRAAGTGAAEVPRGLKPVSRGGLGCLGLPRRFWAARGWRFSFRGLLRQPPSRPHGTNI